MLEFIKFGRAMDEGIRLYNAKHYLDSQYCFDRALELDPNDYQANFWKARVLIYQSNYEEAEKYLARGKDIGETDELIELLDLWCHQPFDLKHGQEPSPHVLQEIDVITKDKLELYNIRRRYSMRDILIYFFYFIISSTVYVGVSQFGKKDLIGDWISGSIFSLLGIWHYYSKVILPLNLWMSYKQILDEFKCLCKDKRYLMLVFLYGSYGFVPNIIGDNPPHSVSLFVVQSFSSFPILAVFSTGLLVIFEEVLFRGTLYPIFCRFFSFLSLNKSISSVIAALIFMFYHGPNFDPSLIALALVCTYLYDTYDTLVAPVILHLIYNFMIFLAVYIKIYS